MTIWLENKLDPGEHILPNSQRWSTLYLVPCPVPIASTCLLTGRGPTTFPAHSWSTSPAGRRTWLGTRGTACSMSSPMRTRRAAFSWSLRREWETLVMVRLSEKTLSCSSREGLGQLQHLKDPRTPRKCVWHQQVGLKYLFLVFLQFYFLSWWWTLLLRLCLLLIPMIFNPYGVSGSTGERSPATTHVSSATPWPLVTSPLAMTILSSQKTFSIK